MTTRNGHDADTSDLAGTVRTEVETDILGALYWVRKARRNGDDSAARQWGDHIDGLLEMWLGAAPS